MSYQSPVVLNRDCTDKEILLKNLYYSISTPQHHDGPVKYAPERRESNQLSPWVHHMHHPPYASISLTAHAEPMPVEPGLAVAKNPTFPKSRCINESVGHSRSHLTTELTALYFILLHTIRNIKNILKTPQHYAANGRHDGSGLIGGRQPIETFGCFGSANYDTVMVSPRPQSVTRTMIMMGHSHEMVPIYVHYH